MTDVGGPEAWLSLHLFYHHVEGQDRLLLEAVAPAVETLRRMGWVERYFFIRYWEGGPHVRLRLSGSRPGWTDAAEAEVRARFSDFVARVPGPGPFAREELARAVPPSAAMDTPSRWYEDHSLHLIPYTAELPRYGGLHAMAYSERLFQHGSDCALALLPALLQAPSRRMGLALELMLLTARALRPQREAGLRHLVSYAGFMSQLVGSPEQLQPQVEQLAAQHGERLGQRLCALEEDFYQGRLTGPYRRWADAVRELCASLARLEADGLLGRYVIEARGEQPREREGSPITAIGMSHLHLLNNRLGVSLRKEAVLAHLIHRLLEPGRSNN